MAQSMSSKPVAVRMLRPALPKTPVAGIENAALFNHWSGVRFDRVSGCPGTTLGRSKVSRLFGSAIGMIGLNGLPDCKFTIGEMLQPDTKRRVRALCSHLNGRS